MSYEESDCMKEFREAQTKIQILCNRDKTVEVTSWVGGSKGLITHIDCPVCGEELVHKTRAFCELCGQRLGFNIMNELLHKEHQ